MTLNGFGFGYITSLAREDFGDVLLIVTKVAIMDVVYVKIVAIKTAFICNEIRLSISIKRLNIKDICMELINFIKDGCLKCAENFKRTGVHETKSTSTT